MLKKLLFIVAILFISSLLFANSETDDLRDICTKIATHSIVRMDYSQAKFVQKIGRSFNTSGNFLFDRERGMAWNTTSPTRSSTILLADRMVRIGSNGKRSEVKAGSNDMFLRFSQAIQAVFTGNIDLIKSQFNVKITWDKSVWIVVFEPVDKDVRSVIKYIQVEGTDYINQVALAEETGDIIRYSFSNIVFPTRLNDDEARYFL